MERLKVPENISLHWELWRGFGAKETILTSIVGAVSIVVAILYVKLQPENPVVPVQAVFGVLLLLIATISFVIKLEYNQSILDYIMKSIRFKREQQQFLYHTEEVLLPYEEEEKE